MAQDGQISSSTTFGKALYELALQSDVHLALEIGTWYGGGSTYQIAKGFVDSGDSSKFLRTLEIFEPAWRYSRQKFLKLGWPVRCILGNTVPTSSYLKEDEIPPNEKTEHFQLYYQRDIELSKQYEPMLKPLCLAYNFDFVLIDGNEYTGWAEFEIVDQICEPKYMALHDMGTLKTSKIQTFIANEKSKWKLIKSGTDAAKWGIYKNVERV